LGWLEFASWTVLAVSTVLYYVNGAAVSRDQFVVRAVLVVSAAVTVVCLRFRRRRARVDTPPPES